jgi:hypothetical protein
MSRLLKVTFLVHMVAAAIVGGLLLVIPGRFLGWVGWAPIDPILSRFLGAALLALAWGSFRGWRTSEREEVAVLIEVEAAFSLLACLALLRHLFLGQWPAGVWALFVVLALFSVAWVVALLQGRK